MTFPFQHLRHLYAPRSWRWAPAWALLLVCMLAAGCQVFPKTTDRAPPSGWEHSNLYNSGVPHSKLYVEIDAVEGQGPSRDELRALEEFLRAHCEKPGGIVIKVDSIIPKQRIAGRPAELLAAEYAHGPPDADAAFMYILFYNTRLREKSAMVDNPSFTTHPFPIVYIDRAYRMFGNLYGRTFSRAILLHETGHALGLCATESHHGEAGHCTNAACLMYRSLTFNGRRFVTFRNPWQNTSLCRECRGDLARNKLAAANPKLEFWHGYLRRREPGYEVLTVPGLRIVRFGEPLSAPTENLAQMRREAAQDIAGRADSYWWAHAETFNPWEHLEAFARFASVEDHGLRLLANELFARIVAALEETAEADPETVLQSLSEEFIAAAKPFPEHEAKFTALREKLSRPTGDGAALAARPEPGSGN